MDPSKPVTEILQYAYDNMTRIVVGTNDDDVDASILPPDGFIVECTFEGLPWVRLCWTPLKVWANALRAQAAVMMTQKALSPEVREWVEAKRDEGIH